MRTTTTDLRAEFERFVLAAARAGLITTDDIATAHLQIGSKTNGVAFRIWLRNPQSGSLSRFPGSRDNGFIGWTRGEADQTLRTMRAVLQDMPRRPEATTEAREIAGQLLRDHAAQEREGGAPDHLVLGLIRIADSI